MSDKFSEWSGFGYTVDIERCYKIMFWWTLKKTFKKEKKTEKQYLFFIWRFLFFLYSVVQQTKNVEFHLIAKINHENVLI